MADSAGTMVLKGIKSGRTYSIDLFLPDAVATEVKFNPTGKALTSSPADFRVSEDSLIVDLTTATAPTAVGGNFRINSGLVNGGAYRYADRLNTLSKRADLLIPVRAGDFISILQH